MTVHPKIIVEDYNPNWVNDFEQLKAKIWPTVDGIATAIEHVGSTSVIDLAAKPVIDIDIVIKSAAVLPGIIERLQSIGYKHRGNLGIEGREAFESKNNSIKHNLYVCLQDAVSFRNHLLLRDRLRRDALARTQYSQLKKDLASKFQNSIEDYVQGKTEFILEILKEEGIEDIDLGMIREANKATR